MIDCDNLLHPFQYDVGTSQRNRVMDDLLSSDTKADGRSLADLLEYFTQLSKQVKYYGPDESSSDWSFFYQRSLPFMLASIVNHKHTSSRKKFENFNRVFSNHYTKTGLQLLFQYVYEELVKKISDWFVELRGSGLAVEAGMEILIRDKLRQPVRNFIGLANTASSKLGIKKLDFEKLRNNTAWELEVTDFYSVTALPGQSRRMQMQALQSGLELIAPAFFNAIQESSKLASKSLGRSFLPLNEELQKNHSPHLGLLFAFLRLFRHLQNDLNKYSKKHLNFFYRDVLRIQPRDSVPDKVHVLFEIQSRLRSHLIASGLLVKDGKDLNKADMLFSLDDEIVVNKAQVRQVRTLFLNYRDVNQKPYLEGEYAAVDATKADGVKEDFEGDLKNWHTMGAEYSKYIDPEFKFEKKYPFARLGFAMGSQVLLLNEGRRTVMLSILCEVNSNCVDIPANAPINQADLFKLLRNAMKKRFVIVDKASIRKARLEGTSNDTLKKLCSLLPDLPPLDCCDGHAPGNIDEILALKEESVQLTFRQWTSFLQNYTPANPGDDIIASEQEALKLFFPEQRLFNIAFSGAKGWITPSRILKMQIRKVNPAPVFKIDIKCQLNAGEPAVTFYNKDVLGEDIGTTLPVVRVLLNPRIKLFYEPVGADSGCCLIKPWDRRPIAVSAYQILRNLSVVENLPAAVPYPYKRPIISVKVQGLKKLIVKSDESVLNVNSDMVAFGARPRIDSNFFIGCPEALLKRWNKFRVNIKWKGLPKYLIIQNNTATGIVIEDFFATYYKAYTDITKGIAEDYFNSDLFLMQPAYLHEGRWIDSVPIEKLLLNGIETSGTTTKTKLRTKYNFERIDFTNQFDETSVDEYLITELTPSTRNGFIRFTLKNRDFQHDRYSYILARQMFAFGKLPDLVYGAVYEGLTVADQKIEVISLDRVFDTIRDALVLLDPARLKIDMVAGEINAVPVGGQLTISQAIFDNMLENDGLIINPTPPFPNPLAPVFPDIPPEMYGARRLIALAQTEVLQKQYDKILDIKRKGVVIPNEPFTPVIREINADYSADAPLSDVQFIHLYPYTGTYKAEEISLKPSLLPSLCDEGNLFIGIEALVPGDNLNILFQMAEATADSEVVQKGVEWYYLSDNTWKPLRSQFEVLRDDTNNLTTSGIVKIATPGNMSITNTIMPAGLHWIRASVQRGSRAVSETRGIHTQAIKVTFTNDTANDKLRLAKPLTAQSISKLQVADAAVKKIEQPYDSFGGRIPEIKKAYYTRVSELLRHKEKAIQKWDYERLVLEAFPQVYKVKCINHSRGLDATTYTNDFPIAPGYVLIAVIPDLNVLSAGGSFQPKVPSSILDQIKTHLMKRATPFARISVENPRYEKVHICIKVQFSLGRDVNFYTQKLKDDIREFLAPWAVGSYSKLSFGQPIQRSDIIHFIERRNYIDFIVDLKLRHESDAAWPAETPVAILPHTPRSILFAGDIDVCVYDDRCGKANENVKSGVAQPLVDYCT